MQVVEVYETRIEERRQRFANESLDDRRRAYAALAWIDHLDVLNRTRAGLGTSCDKLPPLGDNGTRALLADVPTKNMEVE